MTPYAIEHELGHIELGLDTLGPDWADAIIEEASRRGYAIGDELRQAAAAQRLEDLDLLCTACEDGRWNLDYWGEMRRRWTHEGACELFRQERSAGGISEDALPPPAYWWPHDKR